MFWRKGLVVFLVFAALPLWSQVNLGDESPKDGSALGVLARPGEEQSSTEAPMITPAPLSDESYSMTFATETPRTNYLRGEMRVGTAYDDNAVPSSGKIVSDVAYSVWTSLALEQSRSRVRWSLGYSPGYTFHQRLNTIDGVDHGLAAKLEYRWSPHITLRLSNSFQKTRDLLNFRQQNGSTPIPGGVSAPNDSIVPPGTPRTSNFTSGEITDQIGPNAMIGAQGTFSGLWYPNRSQAPDLYDSTGQSGTGFYAHRLSGRHYIGVTYGYQRFLSIGQAETRTQSTLLFYTLYLPSSWSLSVHAGPEHSHSQIFSSLLSLPLQRWSPAAGGSLSWQGAHAAFGSSFEHRVNDGGGLPAAVLSNYADASARWQVLGKLSAALGAGYSTNAVLDSGPLSNFRGHGWSGTASLQHPVGERLALQLGYSHLHQSYVSIAAISQEPDRNYVWMSLSCQFVRPLGR